ncbi:MAG: WD40/YVTN/BNR-like repeat-containing protein [Ferruginibacter sp.]
MRKIFIIVFTTLASNCVKAQAINILTSGTKTSLRGLSVVSDKIIWASGSNGKVAHTSNAGATWDWITVKDFEKRDFRDIEAFNDSTAIIMAVDEPAFILKTSDAGKSWKIVYSNFDKGMFLDAMDFNDDKSGIVVGDPLIGKFFIAYTKDGGETWQEEKKENRPLADTGEACFASSGTNIRLLKNNKKVFISGGKFGHFFYHKRKKNLPLIDGQESTGANSVAFKNNKKFIVVGGDFNTKDGKEKNCFITNNAGRSWYAPIEPPLGYRSCIEFIKDKTWITCGLNGVDITLNDGKNFKALSTENFHVCRLAKKGKSIFFAGSSGRIAVLNSPGF